MQDVEGYDPGTRALYRHERDAPAGVVFHQYSDGAARADILFLEESTDPRYLQGDLPIGEGFLSFLGDALQSEIVSHLVCVEGKPFKKVQSHLRPSGLSATVLSGGSKEETDWVGCRLEAELTAGDSEPTIRQRHPNTSHQQRNPSPYQRACQVDCAMDKDRSDLYNLAP